MADDVVPVERIEAFREERARRGAEVAVTRVIEDGVAGASLKTVARVRALLDAYVRVYHNFLTFIIRESERLADESFTNNPFREVAVSRLVANWLTETEGYLDRSLDVLKGVGPVVRKHFVEAALEELPEGLRGPLLERLEERKQQLLVWFGEELRKARAEVRRSEEDGS